LGVAERLFCRSQSAAVPRAPAPQPNWRAALPSPGGSGVQVVFNMAGANFFGGPAGDIARQWAKALAPEMAQILGRMVYDSRKGAGH
jgi:hypothetical protein